MPDYQPRIVDQDLATAFSQLPAISLVGPRGCGKTTTARHLVPNVVDLSVPDTRHLFNDNPDAALKAVGEPVVLDEWQLVPGLLGAVKRAVDQGDGVGRFILTGSAQAELTTDMWPGTGRVVETRMWPMTVRERLGLTGGRLFVDRVLDPDPLTALSPATNWAQAPSIVDYLELARDGGFPEAVLSLTPPGRERWLRGYIEYVLHRDAGLAGTPTDPVRLGRYLEALALNTAGIVEDRILCQTAGVTTTTGAKYEHLLSRLYLLDTVPAWASNRLTRLVKMHKRYVTDPSLVAAAANLDQATILASGNLYGRLLDTFIAAQIRPELALSTAHPRLYHLRDNGGRHEVDLILEYSLGRVVGIEIKSAASVDRSDARHLIWLSERLGPDRFMAGVVLYSGRVTRELAPGITAAPISTLWGGQ